MGFGQINSDKVDFLHVLFGDSEPQKIPRKNRVVVTVCERNLSFEKRGMLRSWFGKIPPNKQRLVEAMFFFEPSLQTRNVELLMATTLSHYAAKIPQAGCIMKKAWTCGTLWPPRGTLNKVVECPCHPGALIISDHLLDASSKNKVNLIERKTNKSRSKASSGSRSTMFMCMHFIRLWSCMGILCRSLFFFKKGFNFFYIYTINIQKEPPFWVVDSSYGFMEQPKTREKKNGKKPGDPIVDRKLPPLWYGAANRINIKIVPKTVKCQALSVYYAYHPWSMYRIFTFIWLKSMVNVGKYTTHGCYGL